LTCKRSSSISKLESSQPTDSSFEQWLRLDLGGVLDSKAGSFSCLEWAKNSSRSLPSATTHRSAPVDDKSGAGGLLPGEMPRILNICAHCEPIARCPIDFMPLASRNTSAGRPVVLDTALLPRPFLPPSAKETRCDCLCPDGSSLHGNAANIAARLAAAKPLPIG
jgi:hypothetical protein